MKDIKELRDRLISGVKPCPCCGNKDLYLGHTSAFTLGVVCWSHGGGCGLKMEVELPERVKRGKTLQQVECDCLEQAVKLWDRRK